MPPERSIERDILEIIAYHDPIDWRLTLTKLRERVHGSVDKSTYRDAEANLTELGLIERPGMAHEFFHITDKGWKHLGGETPRRDRDINPGTVPICPVCEADDIVESSW